MERKLVLFVAGLSLIAIGLAIFLPGGRTPDELPKLPWKISLDQDGNASVLGIILGRTTLGEAQAIFDAEAKINLFTATDQGHAVEAYFERLFLSGIKADLILSLDLPQQEAERMFRRGLRVSTLGSGDRKVVLTPEDQRAMQQRPINHITYLPAADLEPKLISNLFGEPKRRIPGKAGVTHWLYPEKGLDIALNPDGKEVFQYVPPSRFERLVGPLQQTEPRTNRIEQNNDD